MAYDYETQRHRIFTEAGIEMLLDMKGRASKLLESAGAVRMQELMSATSGDVWDMLAVADYLVEKRFLREITSNVAGQHRVFVRGAS